MDIRTRKKKNKLMVTDYLNQYKLPIGLVVNIFHFQVVLACQVELATKKLD